MNIEGGGPKILGIFGVGGGLPIIVDGEVVGGIGLSSGTPQQDMTCAQAAIDYFMENTVL